MAQDTGIQNLDEQTPNLEKRSTLDEFKHFADSFQTFDEVASARELSEVLLWLFSKNPDFPIKQPELFDEYQELLIRSRWVALPILSEKGVVEMFEKYLIDGLTMGDLDVLEKFKAKLKNILLLENRDKLKKLVAEAIVRNEQYLSQAKIETSQEKRQPRVGNWVKDFTAYTSGDILDNVKETQYFTKSKNVSQLSKEEKEILKKMLEVYKWCHLSSFDLRGFEDSIPVDDESRKGVISGGKFEEIKPAEEKRVAELIKEAQEMLERAQKGEKIGEVTPEVQKEILAFAYLGDEEERNKVHRAEQEITRTSQSQIKTVESILVDSIYSQEKYLAAAALRLLAKKTDLIKTMEENKDIFDLAKENIKNNYSDDILADFQRNKFIPAYLSVFLQHVMKNKLKMTSDESARLGIQLENLIVRHGAKEMLGMVYGDLEKGVYVWHQVKDKGTRLELPKEV